VHVINDSSRNLQQPTTASQQPKKSRGVLIHQKVERGAPAWNFGKQLKLRRHQIDKSFFSILVGINQQRW
jgi:hypothetical protein